LKEIKDLNLSQYKKDQKDILDDLFQIGLIWKDSKEGSDFIVTPLVTNFLYEKSHKFNTESNLNLIVETNFRIYAYTQSSFHESLLRLFTKIDYKLPNMIVGTLTEESIKKAVNTGIKKEQIIKFMNKNIHPAQRNLVEKEKAKANYAHVMGTTDILEKIKNDSMYSGSTENMIPENILQQIEMWENEKEMHFSKEKEQDDDDL